MLDALSAGLPWEAAGRSRTATAAAVSRAESMETAFVEYFRCPEAMAPVETRSRLSPEEGYFRFGEAVCYGRHSAARPGPVTADLVDVSSAVRYEDGGLRLPFDLSEVVTNLRQERYRQTAHHHHLEWLSGGAATRSLYYFLRPILPVGVRRHLQRIRLSGWQRIPFPRWPVDVSVETLMRDSMALLLKHGGIDRIPFIWFWPDAASGCAIVTHDVESPRGRDFCGPLMDLDDSFGIKSAFQVVPAARGGAWTRLVQDLRSRGFEVNLHDLNHDGYLYQSREQFLQRAAQINAYARRLDCRGFRAGAMYREQRWYDAFDFSYDMSVPNGAHLEPQRGGCCTVLPYFIGRILELPLTTTQDYSLFHVLGEYSTALWERQIEEILSNHGMVTILTHPDYLIEERARAVYVELLAHLSRLRADRHVWITLPQDVDRWWRNRRLMKLRPVGDSWAIEGPGSDRACLAWAALDGDRVTYSLDEAA